ncbi:NifU family protein [Olivibacter sitiensis]|uniref:NifU family protein n=1 Tax=Olivibacter sitiensis TaxID=376470 RepID=UPI0004256F8E|nr:NifU family protein [Olivibacter sitiensis]
MGASLKEKVEQALDTMRPYLEADGGNVSIEEITPDNVVKLRLLGSCASCSMSIMTFKAGLEQAIKKAVPEISSVEAINITDIKDANAISPNALG